MQEGRLPNFVGKVVVVYTGVDSGAAVTDAEFQKYEGRLFLTGTIAQGNSIGNWLGGVRYAVAWEAVREYALFDSVDDYLLRSAQANAARPLLSRIFG